MNAGTDYHKARRQAQANANRSRQPWRIFMHAGTWWVERARSPETKEIVHPEPEELVRPEQD